MEPVSELPWREGTGNPELAPVRGRRHADPAPEDVGEVTLIREPRGERDLGERLVARGQLVGGAVQGISGALREQLVYDEGGQLLTATFMDYSLPRATDFPRVEGLVLEDEPAPNPLGVKGIGEGGTSGAGAAIANAVFDAVGVRLRHIPFTPERVRAALAGETIN